MKTQFNKSIILGNSPSSGSSLLVSLLGVHSDIFQTRELNVFDKPDWCAGRTYKLKNRWPRFKRMKYDVHFPCEHQILFNGLEEIPDFSVSQHDYANFAIETMKAMANEKGFSSFVEKTPNNIFALPHIYDRIPDAQFIMIIRHPVSVYRSLRRRGYDPFTSVARWYFPNLVVNYMREKDRTILVKYEQLTRDPENEIKRIFDFLQMTAPDKSALDARETSDVINVGSWTKDVRGAVVSEAVENTVPDEMYDIFRKIRSNSYFERYCGISDASLSPMDLSAGFGYDLLPPKELIKKSSLLQFPWPRYARYLASCAKHRRLLRPFWHRWSSE